MDHNHCEKLLDEYQALRRRLEEIDFANADIDDTPGINQPDINRLKQLQERLHTECDIALPEETEDDIDLPDYASEAPSEPRNDL